MNNYWKVLKKFGSDGCAWLCKSNPTRFLLYTVFLCLIQDIDKYIHMFFMAQYIRNYDACQKNPNFLLLISFLEIKQLKNPGKLAGL